MSEVQCSCVGSFTGARTENSGLLDPLGPEFRVHPVPGSTRGCRPRIALARFTSRPQTAGFPRRRSKSAGRLITHHNEYYSAQPVSPVLLTACRLMPTHHTDYSLLIFGNKASDKCAGVTLTLTDYPLLLLSAGNAIPMTSSFHLFF